MTKGVRLSKTKEVKKEKIGTLAQRSKIEKRKEKRDKLIGRLHKQAVSDGKIKRSDQPLKISKKKPSEALESLKDMINPLLEASLETQRISPKSKQEILKLEKSEKNLFKAVLAHGAFKADPLAAITEHVNNAVALERKKYEKEELERKKMEEELGRLEKKKRRMELEQKDGKSNGMGVRNLAIRKKAKSEDGITKETRMNNFGLDRKQDKRVEGNFNIGINKIGGKSVESKFKTDSKKAKMPLPNDTSNRKKKKAKRTLSKSKTAIN